MLSIKEFQDLKIYSAHMILGGQGTSGSGSCNTACDGESSDCKSYTYEDDCNGENRIITSETTVDGPCEM